MPICIAGMHRSGTSLVTHLLQVCGLHLGDDRDLVPASVANPDGYWEHRRFVDINEELLRVLGGDWATPARIPEPSSPEWVRNASLARLRNAAQELCANFAGHEPWGWKDPRNSLTLPFWFSQEPALKIVVCVRHPLEVAASLRRIDPNTSIASGVERWMACYQRLLSDASSEKRVLTHAGSYFCEPAAEVRRVAGFAGLSPGAGALERCLAIIRPELRRNPFTSDEVADFELPRQALELYGRLCEEAAWDEGRARALTSAWAPNGAVAVEEHERLVAARNAHARRLAAVDAMFVKQEEDFRQELDRRDDDLLAAMQEGITVRGATREYRRRVEYRRMVRNVRRVVRDVVPERRAILVMSRGDHDLLVGPNAVCFPQGADGAYSGYHPATSLAAIGHLEALRAGGAEFLVIPTTELWWLEQYREFGRHVRERYQAVLEDPWSCTIFALRQTAAKGRTEADEFQDAMSACEEVLQREPSILDWGTGRRLASEFPDRTVFGPPVDDHVLPYLERSIDVVAVPAGLPERIVEAERVASTAVVVFPAAADSPQPIDVRWLNGSTGQLPTVSILVAVADEERDSSPALRSVRENLAERFNAEVLTSGDVAVAASRATGEILVFLAPDAVVLPDWIAPLLRLFRDRPKAGAAGGKVFSRDGRLEYGGGSVTAGAALHSIAEEEYTAGGPASEVMRQVDWCSPMILATRRSLFIELGGFGHDGHSRPYEAADYCLRLKERGHDVLFQPDTAVVRAGTATEPGAPPDAFAQRWLR